MRATGRKRDRQTDSQRELVDSYCKLFADDCKIYKEMEHLQDFEQVQKLVNGEDIGAPIIAKKKEKVPVETASKEEKWMNIEKFNKFKNLASSEFSSLRLMPATLA